MAKFLITILVLNSSIFAQHNLCGIWAFDETISGKYTKAFLIDKQCESFFSGYFYDEDENRDYTIYYFSGSIYENNLIGTASIVNHYFGVKQNKRITIRANLMNDSVMQYPRYEYSLPPYRDSETDISFFKIKRINKDEINYRRVIHALSRYRIDKKNCSCDTVRDSLVEKQLTLDSNIVNRENKVIQTIIYKGDHVLVKLKDNNQIDGDIVSVYLDQKLIKSNIKLKRRNKKIKISLPTNRKDHTLLFVAENIGEVPPNTADIEMIFNEKRVSLRLNCDMKTNSSIILKQEE